MALIDKASLLMVPSTYEDGTLYNILPSGNKAPDETGNHNAYDQTRADFTFSRGSNLAATRVNADGLIEKGRENLLLQSNSFDTTWTLTGSTLASGQTDKDGGTSAWKLTSSNTGQSFFKQVVSSSGVATYSVYAKAGDANFIVVYAVGGGDPRTFFDLENGTTETAAHNITNKIEDVGNGWYRCSVIFNKTITDVRLFIADSDNVFNSGNGSSIYIQNAQLEYGLVATPYIETGATTATAGVLENTPRIDYSSGAGALLLEPQRTNDWKYSEPTSGAIGSINAVGGFSDINSFSSIGLYGGAILQGGATQYIYDGPSIANSTTYTFSCYMKTSDGAAPVLANSSGSASGDFVFIIGGATKTALDPSIDYSITQFKGDIYKVVATMTSASSVTNPPNNGIIKFDTNRNADLEVTGLQWELGSYATSYVPTYGSAATRGAELCKKTDINDVIGGTQGTIFFDVTMSESLTNTNYKQFFYYTDSGGTNQTYMYVSNTNYIVGNPNLGNIISSTQMEAGQRYKIAVTYATNSFKMYVNGSQDATSSSGTPKDNENIISIGSYNGTSEFNEFTFNQYIHFKEVLSDSELATLTTL